MSSFTSELLFDVHICVILPVGLLRIDTPPFTEQ